MPHLGEWEGRGGEGRGGEGRGGEGRGGEGRGGEGGEGRGGEGRGVGGEERGGEGGGWRLAEREGVGNSLRASSSLVDSGSEAISSRSLCRRLDHPTHVTTTYSSNSFGRRPTVAKILGGGGGGGIDQQCVHTWSGWWTDSPF